jgi:hypothetical protein
MVKPVPSRLIFFFVFLGFLVLYYSNGRAPAGVDSFSFPYTAWSIIRHGSMDLRDYRELDYLVGSHVYERADGSRFALRSPGCALVALPVVAPAALCCERPPKSSIMFHFGKLTSAILVSLAAVLFFMICSRLAPTAAWPATVLFGAGTCLFSVASQQLWTHGPATFWLCCCLLAMLPSDGTLGTARSSLGGIALGMAILTRPTTAFFAIATILALLARRDWRAAFGVVLGALLPVAYYCGGNLATYGNLFVGGYVNDDWNTSTPLWLGIPGLLIAPSRGVLVYTPAFVLLPLGLYALLARRLPGVLPWPRLLILAWSAASAATLVFFARWHDWYGGWCFGPRFLCECMPTACVLVALAFSSLPGIRQRRLAYALIALSVFIQCVGVFGHRAETDWYVQHEKPDGGRWLFSPEETQIETYTQAFFQKTGERLGLWTR